MTDPFELQRFVEAQQDTYERALAELRAGRKRSHWMWFVFPQIAGLGASPMAQRYAIASLEEAAAYLAHPILGPRLLACTEAVAHHAGSSANAIFGSPDDMKFRSCMTLFAEIAPDDALFDTALHLFYDGRRDQKTLDLITA